MKSSRQQSPRSRKIDPGTVVGLIGMWGGLSVGLAAIVLFALPAVVPGLRDVTLGTFKPFDIGGRAIGSTFTSRPYYPDVVRRIQHSSKFAAILGSPIAVDSGGVSCIYLSDDTVQGKANCNIPVHGPRGAAFVHVQVVAQSGSLDWGRGCTSVTDRFRSTRSREIPASARGFGYGCKSTRESEMWERPVR